jgi:hypothetical protein
MTHVWLMALAEPLRREQEKQVDWWARYTDLWHSTKIELIEAHGPMPLSVTILWGKAFRSALRGHKIRMQGVARPPAPSSYTIKPPECDEETLEGDGDIYDWLRFQLWLSSKRAKVRKDWPGWLLTNW